MSAQNHNISNAHTDVVATIRQLDDATANRIAAGEVVERPASAVKELVENALDAGATHVEICVKDGGKTLIRVSDDGCGIAADQLQLALSRHATSKIDGSDLLNIHTFGFRGEALPSMGAVGRMVITSRVRGASHGAEIRVDAGKISDVKPAALSQGTTVELRNLFYATPARLKFLRSDRAEMAALNDVVKRLAIVEPHVGFVLRDQTRDETGRITFRAQAQSGDLFDAIAGRLRQILGAEFAENALPIKAEREGVELTGYAALPTYSRGSSAAQFLFVNGRPVRDKLLVGALRGAYADFLSRDRHPACALFLNLAPEQVDVNVHPAKAEVRFRNPGLVRGLIVSALKHALAQAGHRASSTVATAALGAFQAEKAPQGAVYQMHRPPRAALQQAYAAQSPEALSEAPSGGYIAQHHPAQPGFSEQAQDFAPMSARVDMPFEGVGGEVSSSGALSDLPLGVARGQVHENYIVAQTADGMVIVDQHAAHERLVYEKLKAQMAQHGVAAQALLIPEILELSETDAALLLQHADVLAKLGLTLEPFGAGAVVVRETPAILGEIDAQALLRDILDELDELGESLLVGEKIDAVLSRVACHGSIRSGRRMRAEEMNALLREMEATPYSGQCNHGRPTYVELKLSDIERLFGRT